MSSPQNGGRCCPVCFQAGPACQCGSEPEDVAVAGMHECLRCRQPLIARCAHDWRSIRGCSFIKWCAECGALDCDERPELRYFPRRFVYCSSCVPFAARELNPPRCLG